MPRRRFSLHEIPHITAFVLRLVGLQVTSPFVIEDEEVGHAQNDGQAYSPAHDSPLPTGSFHGDEFHIPRHRQLQPTFAHEPLSPELRLDESAWRSAHTGPVPSADQTTSRE